MLTSSGNNLEYNISLEKQENLFMSVLITLEIS